MNRKNNNNESLIEYIDSLISELNIVKNHVLNNDLQTASEYTDGIVTGSEELRDKIDENDD
mgnify:FL=1